MLILFLLIIAWILIMVATGLIWIHRMMRCMQAPPREEFEQERELTALRLSSPHVLEVHIPPHEHPAPSAFANARARYADAGLVIKEAGEGEEGPPARYVLRVTDGSALLHSPEAGLSRVLSVLPSESDKYLTCLGNMEARKLVTQDDEDAGASLPALFRKRRKDGGGDKPPLPLPLRVVCAREVDALVFRQVLAACDGISDETAYSASAEADVVGEAAFVEAATRALSGVAPAVCIAFAGKLHPLWEALKAAGDRYAWLGYEPMAMSTLKLRLPFAKRTGLDVRQVFDLPTVQGRRRTYNLLAVPSLLIGAGTTEMESHPLLPLAARVFITQVTDGSVAGETVGANNMMGLTFRMYAVTLERLRAHNAEIYKKRHSMAADQGLHVGRPRFSVLEQFQQESDERRSPMLEVEVSDREVHGYHTLIHDRRVGRLTLLPSRGDTKADADADRGTVRGMPLRMWDRVILKAQRRASENGTYYVARLRPSVVLESALVIPALEGVDAFLQTASGVFYVDMAWDARRENITRLRDIQPGLRTSDVIWDRPCKENAECPFYQANDRYRNYRGGCIAGYCEVPLGVKRMGFRRYDAGSKPLCHGGAQRRSPRGHECDAEHPDLAFELDEFERRAQGV